MILAISRFAALVLLWVSAIAAAQAEPCRIETFDGARYTVCSFDVTKSDLRIFLSDASGAPYRTFAALEADLEASGKQLRFAMNGGMYDENFRPIGLHVEAGREIAAANTETVAGAPGDIPNFYKKPNGVFYIGGERAGIMETEQFLKAMPAADYATQSGPMLVIDRAIHPAFIVGSTDRKSRNGVGISGTTEVHFAISEERVNFHDLARFFRDHLGCDDALFLDGGTAPGLYAPELGRDDAPGHGGYGPIIGVVAPR